MAKINCSRFIVVDSYKGILSSNEKEKTTDIHKNMDKSQGIMCSERNWTQNHKIYTLYYSMYMKSKNRQH